MGAKETMALVGKMVLVALVAGVVGLAVGYFLGHDPVPELEQELASAKSDHKANSTRTEKAHAEEMGALRARTQVLEKRATVQEAALAVRRAIDSLDARNFGTAQSQIDAAEELLRQRDDLAQSVRELQNELSKLRLVAATDFGKQRAELLSLAQGLGTEAAAMVPVE